MTVAQLIESWLKAGPEERKRIEIAALITLERSIADLKRELARSRRKHRELHDDDDDPDDEE